MENKDLGFSEEETILRKVQMVELEILLEFDRICKMHSLPYQLFAGTLLGAIRHQGFIPWDDDIDICMLREDYEKFVHVASKDLNASYFLQTYKTDVNFFNSFAKIRKNNTLLVEKDTETSAMHKGIFIDIMPLDNVKFNTWQGEMQRKILYSLQVINQTRFKNNCYKANNPVKRATLLFFHYALKIMPKHFIDRIIDKIATINSKSETGYVSDFGTASHKTAYQNFTMETKDFKDSIEGKFEKHVFPIPRRYDAVLKKNYGDYLALPPESKRTSHHGITKICFGDSKETNSI